MGAQGLKKRVSALVTRAFGTGRTVILKYHRVLPSADAMRPGEVTADEFDAQMRAVASAFRSETLADLIDARRERRRENTVVVTFDDGYRDNHDVALPIMQRHGVRATIFVASGYLAGGAMWNDRLLESMRKRVGQTVNLEAVGLGSVALGSLEQAGRVAHDVLGVIKRWPPERRAQFVDDFAADGAGEPRVMLNAAEVKALADAGMEIGAHTVTHPILSKLSAEDARREISASKRELEDILGRPVRTFAYPNGRPGKDFTPADVERVREAGYAGAVTTEWGCATTAADDYLIPRQGIWGTSQAKLWLQLLRNFRA